VPALPHLNRRQALALAGSALACPAVAEILPNVRTLDIRHELGGDGDITAILLGLRARGIVRAYLAPGRYSVAPGTALADLTLEGAGVDTLIVPGTGDWPHFLLTSEGRSVPLAGLASATQAGDSSVRLQGTADCRPGDLIQIYDPRPSSLSGRRPVYRAGEFALVASTEGRKVNLLTPLMGLYRPISTRLARIEPSRITLKNLRFESGKFGAVRLTHGRGIILASVLVECAAAHGVYIDRCFDFQAIDCSIDNRGAGSASDYGLAVGNSQVGRISGGSFYGRRHGIGLGGGDLADGSPTSNITISGCTLANDPRNGAPTADIHGNCRNISYENCRIENGATVAGLNARYDRCEIGAMRNGVCIYGGEMLGGLFTIEGCDLTSRADPSAEYRGILDFGGNSLAIDKSALGPISIEIRNTTVRATKQGPKSTIIELRNRGSYFPVNLTVTGLKLDVNAGRCVVSLRSRDKDRWNGQLDIAPVSGRPAGARLSEFGTIP
jgi:hypothetical protein